jgi:5-methyltetrahydropteroyltriglutamate--homocysteine methyltransferase
MVTLVDDVGSFPLPSDVDSNLFEEMFRIARKALLTGKTCKQDESLVEGFERIVVDSFLTKAKTGIDVVNYPQHYDMHRQLADIVGEAMNEGTYSIDQKDAVIPEVQAILKDSKKISEEIGGKIQLRVCVEGPIEFYLKEIGSVVQEDVIRQFAENIRLFARNSILNTKHIQTVAVSLDEPSFGFQNVVAEKEVIQDALERAFGFTGAVRQIHLHSPARISDLLNISNIDVLSIEFAASPRNIESVTAKMLDLHDKQIRVGISRTDIDSIVAELHDKGVPHPEQAQIVEDQGTIRRRYELAKAKFMDRLTFTGPDCGLGGWPSQESAQLLLSETVKAVTSIR